MGSGATWGLLTTRPKGSSTERGRALLSPFLRLLVAALMRRMPPLGAAWRDVGQGSMAVGCGRSQGVGQSERLSPGAGDRVCKGMQVHAFTLSPGVAPGAPLQTRGCGRTPRAEAASAGSGLPADV